MPARKLQKGRRRQGRPSTSVAVGGEAIIAAAREALKVTPPGEITFQQVSRLAGTDNKLIRYYFGYMPDLLRAVAVQVTEELRNRFATVNTRTSAARDNLRLRVSIFLDFFGGNPHYHRLVVDYLIKTESPDRNAALERFRYSIGELHKVLNQIGAPGEDYPLDARFIHISMAAVCEFMSSAKPVFAALFDEDIETPAFKERFCDFVTDLIMGAAATKEVGAKLAAAHA
jgi:AcrR family transcriptional regulator